MLIDDLKVSGILLSLDQLHNKSPYRILNEFGPVLMFSRIFIDYS